MKEIIILFGYGLMFIAQSFGPDVIEALHGPAARADATAPIYDDVKPDAPLDLLCQGYEAHHYNQVSNCFHAAGMVLSFLTVCSMIISRRFEIFFSLPPIWYLYAWAGHFLIQKDIPAVFVYGMTLRGWLSGEYCSISSLLGGRTLTELWEYGLMMLIVIFHMILLPPVPFWGLVERQVEKKRPKVK
jgi:hypothetical protein